MNVNLVKTVLGLLLLILAYHVTLPVLLAQEVSHPNAHPALTALISLNLTNAPVS